MRRRRFRCPDEACKRTDSFGVPQRDLMSRRKTAPLIIVLAAMALVVPGSVWADDDDDHERARELYEHGEIESLHDILEKVRGTISGDIVAVDLMQTEGRWIYRFQIIAPDGRRTTRDVDAHDLAEDEDEESSEDD